MNKWLLISPLLVLVALELFFRVGIGLGDPVIAQYDKDVEYVLKPSSSFKRFGNAIVINSHHLRGGEIITPKPANEYRVLIIGDSVVYGGHRIDQTEIISEQLALSLNKTNSRCQFSVIAVAASSWGPENQLAYLQRFGTFEADRAFYVLSSHDRRDIPTFNHYDISYATSAYYGGLHEAIDKIKRKLFPAKPVRSSQVSREEKQRRSELAIQNILDQLVNDGIQATLVFHPITREINQSYKDGYRELLSSRNDVDYLSLFDTYANDDIGMIFRDHIHPTAYGAKVIAGRFYEDVLKSVPQC